MGSFIEDAECCFFDAQEDITWLSEPNSDSRENYQSNSDFNHWVVWGGSPQSVRERRRKFLQRMGLNFNQDFEDCSVNFRTNVNYKGGDMVREKNDDTASVSFAMEDSSGSSQMDSEKTFLSRNKRLVSCVGEKMDTGEVDSNQLPMAEEPDKASGSSARVKKPVAKIDYLIGKLKLNRVKRVWFENRWNGEGSQVRPNETAVLKPKVQKVKVRRCRKEFKELSALFMVQDFQAHEGSILAIKFSPDGLYLASGGEDGILRLWQVMEKESFSETDTPEMIEMDPSCFCFRANHPTELKPHLKDKEESCRSMSLNKTLDSACVVFPEKYFRILDKPVREFHGHSKEILDLSWSKSNHLLSSSVDKTVRHWQVGRDNCLKMFPHTDYVTSVEFNPVDDDYFISGSIDGKIRIWRISSCQVVGWTCIRDIVTAVCYQPDGQRVVCGSMTGTCRFYRALDNCLQLDAQVNLSCKKSPCKKITGFHFFPQDPSKLMVTCADSGVRILQEFKEIAVYQGLCKVGNQFSASFTSDGNHIVSACGNSSVCVWNWHDQNEPTFSQARKVSSFEHFSTNASIAIPWQGQRGDNSDKGRRHCVSEERLLETVPSYLPARFSSGQEYSSDSFAKGSATWPEEKLSTSLLIGKPSRMQKSKARFLKSSSQSTPRSHAWGLVIVTAGCDGRIKSFHNYGLPVAL